MHTLSACTLRWCETELMPRSCLCRLRCLSMQNLSITDDSMGLLLLAITHVFSPMGGDCAPTGLLSE